MKIKTKLSLLFSFIFGMILLLFIVGVYHFYSDKCHDDYFERLHLRAALKVDLIDGETIDPEVFHLLYQNAPKDYEPQVAIYTQSGKLIYHDKQSLLPEEERLQILEQIRLCGQCKLWHGERQTFGFLIEGNKGDYIVTVSGYDQHGNAQLRTLRITLGVAYLIALFCIILVIRLFIKQAFRPVAQMMEKVNHITTSHQLSIRLNEGNRKDELSELAVTFNQMLSQLETSFEAQKQFVYHISHELRTPLSAIITELELSRSANPRTSDYPAAIDRALQDARRLSKLSTHLLDMAKANYSPSEIAMHPLRLDELLLEVCRKIQKAEPDYIIHILFDQDEFDDERLISLRGNEYLLGVAFANLIDNGCKYSDNHTCEVHISYQSTQSVIHIIDHGIGIPAQEQPAIFTPFFRGSNQHFADGNGVGLSLAHKIVELHGGNIALQSQPGCTCFTIRLRNLLPGKAAAPADAYGLPDCAQE
ncbi:MAG: HAMP domain-containing sensor histidine kinase [Bacteroides sp.]